MKWKQLARALLFPPLAVLFLLPGLSAALLVYSMRALEEENPLRIASYVLAFYALSICCARAPALFRRLQRLRQENRHLARWRADARLRVNVTLVASALYNGAYAALQLALGLRHHTAWFYSLAAYYALLAAMRLHLARHTLRHSPGERPQQELRRYRACGWVFLLTNLALSAMIFSMLHAARAVRHHEITTIALAAYTFTSLTMAVINVLRYRKYNSPAFSASKAISLAAGCVSMLTLENTMLQTFHTENMTPQTARLFLRLSGGAISIFIIAMALCMIAQANRKLKNLENER